MKNFKKIALGLLVGALAIGFSAFTNAKGSKIGQTTYYYGLTSDGTTYDNAGTSDPSADCVTTSNYPSCIIHYSSPQTAPFSKNSVPPGGTPEGGNGYDSGL